MSPITPDSGGQIGLPYLLRLRSWSLLLPVGCPGDVFSVRPCLFLDEPKSVPGRRRGVKLLAVPLAYTVLSRRPRELLYPAQYAISTKSKRGWGEDVLDRSIVIVPMPNKAHATKMDRPAGV